MIELIIAAILEEMKSNSVFKEELKKIEQQKKFLEQQLEQAEKEEENEKGEKIEEKKEETRSASKSKVSQTTPQKNQEGKQQETPPNKKLAKVLTITKTINAFKGPKGSEKKDIIEEKDQ